MFERIKESIYAFIWRVFFKKHNPSRNESNEVTDIANDNSTESVEQQLERFKMHNVVFEKLSYLEQRIKTFSLNFPDEYNSYLKTIQSHQQEYELELKNYNNGFLGIITFSIDPESESKRLIAVSNLENEITNFIEYEVNFSVYKNKFFKLCSKSSQFYHALFDTKKDVSVISAQLNNAINALTKLIEEVKPLDFFKRDSRKKEEILNYIIYCEYLFFKSSVRCSLVHNLDNYKRDLSKFHYLFIDSEYDRLMFKFFIDDLEQYQVYITSNLSQDKMYDYILANCQGLQNSLNNSETVFFDDNFFDELIKFENTLDNISENCGGKFTVQLPDCLQSSNNCKNDVCTKDTATSILSMLDCNKATILGKIIDNFKSDISLREFYFLCKIFELSKDVKQVCFNTIFGFVHDKFYEYEERYSQYSDSFIMSEKEKILTYKGRKQKKYIFLLSVPEKYISIVEDELKMLKLDFKISDTNIYLNHSYFNGFKNLEKNFGYNTEMEAI